MVGLISNQIYDPGYHMLYKVIKCLNSYDIIPVTPHKIEFLSCDYIIANPYDHKDIFVIGGDGSMLRAASRANNQCLIGINKRHLGFLCAMNFDNLENGIENYIYKPVFREKRMRIETDIKVENHFGRQTSLNEILITKRDYQVNTLRMNLFVNGNPINEFVADGLIISTPTGSSAYSLSCNGPLLDPESEMIIVNPVNAHDLNVRPLVLPANANISIAIENIENARLVIDGITGYNFRSNVIDVNKSNKYVSIMKFERSNYYKALKSKLG